MGTLPGEGNGRPASPAWEYVPPLLRSPRPQGSPPAQRALEPVAAGPARLRRPVHPAPCPAALGSLLGSSDILQEKWKQPSGLIPAQAFWNGPPRPSNQTLAHFLPFSKKAPCCFSGKDAVILYPASTWGRMAVSAVVGAGVHSCTPKANSRPLVRLGGYRRGLARLQSTGTAQLSLKGAGLYPTSLGLRKRCRSESCLSKDSLWG